MTWKNRPTIRVLPGQTAFALAVRRRDEEVVALGESAKKAVSLDTYLDEVMRSERLGDIKNRIENPANAKRHLLIVINKGLGWQVQSETDPESESFAKPAQRSSQP